MVGAGHNVDTNSATRLLTLFPTTLPFRFDDVSDLSITKAEALEDGLSAIAVTAIATRSKTSNFILTKL